MKYRNRTTAEILTGIQIKRLNPNVSFAPNTFSDLGYDAVKSTPKPEPTTDLKVVYSDGVVQDSDGNWIESWAEADKFSGTNKADQELAYLAQKKIDLINEKRDLLFWANVPYGGTSVQFRDAEDRTTITNLAQKADRLVAAGTPTATVPLILEDDSIAQIEASDFVTLSDNIMALKAGIRVYARTLKNSVLAATTETALNAIDHEAGWPS